MKVNLELKFNLPEDREDYYQYVNAPKLGSILWEITHNLRKRCDREADALDPEADQSAYDGIEIVFEHIYKMLEEHNIDTNELM
jgi:hypothetical protein